MKLKKIFPLRFVSLAFVAMFVFNFQVPVASAASLTGSYGGSSKTDCYYAAAEIHAKGVHEANAEVHVDNGTDSRNYFMVAPAYEQSNNIQKYAFSYQIASSFQNAFFGMLKMGSGSKTINPDTPDPTCLWRNFSGLIIDEGKAQLIGSAAGVSLRAAGKGGYTPPNQTIPDYYSTSYIADFSGHGAGLASGVSTFTNSSGGKTEYSSPSADGSMKLVQKPLYPISILVDDQGKRVGDIYSSGYSCGATAYYKDAEGEADFIGSISHQDESTSVGVYPGQNFSQGSSYSQGAPGDPDDLNKIISGRSVKYYFDENSPIVDPNKLGLCTPTSNPKEYSCPSGLPPTADSIAQFNQDVAGFAGSGLKLVTFNVVEATARPAFVWPVWTERDENNNLVGPLPDEGELREWASQVPATLVSACSPQPVKVNTSTASCSVSASPSSATTGSSVVWTANVSPSDSYTYTWSASGTASGNTLTTSYSSPGEYSVTTTAKDSAGGSTQCSNTITVKSATSVIVPSCEVIPSPVKVGSPATFRASATGGSGAYTFTWSDETGVIGTGPSITKTFSSPDLKYITVDVASVGFENKQCFVQLQVINEPLKADASCSVAPSSVTVGEGATWTAPTPTGGTGSYSYEWSGDIDASANDKTLKAVTSKPYTTQGTKMASVKISSGLQSVSANCSLPVSSKPIITPPLPNLIPLGASVLSLGPNRPIPSCPQNPNGTCLLGSTVTFEVQPQNIGLGFAGPDFSVKLQKKSANADENSYSDVGTTAKVSGGLAFLESVTKTVEYSSLASDSSSAGYDFRYCVDLPPSPNGLVNEGSNEGDNCSGSTNLVFAKDTTVETPKNVTPAKGACTNPATGKINISWSPVAEAEGYRVYRGSSRNFSADSNTLVKSVNTPSYSDSGLAPRVDHYYRVAAYRGAVTSNPSESVMSQASETCPDLTIENIELKSGGKTVTQVVAGQRISFATMVKNTGGDFSGTFNNQFVLSKQGVNLLSPPIVSLSGSDLKRDSNLSPLKTLSSWPSVEGDDYKITVCTDQPPEQPGLIKEDNNAHNADTISSNCSSKIFSVLPGSSSLINVTLQADPLIIDYNNPAKLQWTTTGNPRGCSWVTSDSKEFSTPSPTGGNLTTGSLTSKIKFAYQLQCQ
ncbi:MAG: PKD domain-containing protein [Patescibacteria group bacterium]